MSLPCKSERSRLSHDEFELVRVTHHPAIYELSPDQLRALKVRLREQRNMARALARQKQRELRGKATQVALPYRLRRFGYTRRSGRGKQPGLTKARKASQVAISTNPIYGDGYLGWGKV